MATVCSAPHDLRQCPRHPAEHKDSRRAGESDHRDAYIGKGGDGDQVRRQVPCLLVREDACEERVAASLLQVARGAGVVLKHVAPLAGRGEGRLPLVKDVAADAH